MRGMTEKMTIGERVAFYRRRRGLSQAVLAGLVARTEDWLSRVENNKIEMDRLSVIRRLAEALDVTIGDVVGDPTLLDWTSDSGVRTVPALRAALMDYRQIAPALAGASSLDEPPGLDTIERDVAALFDAYQASRYGYVTGRAPLVLADALYAVRAAGGGESERAHALLASGLSGGRVGADQARARPTSHGSLPSAGSPRRSRPTIRSSSVRSSDQSRMRFCRRAGSRPASNWCARRRVSCNRISAATPTTRCCPCTERYSLPGPWPHREPTTERRRRRSFVRRRIRRAGSAGTRTRCGQPSGPRTSRSTA